MNRVIIATAALALGALSVVASAQTPPPPAPSPMGGGAADMRGGPSMGRDGMRADEAGPERMDRDRMGPGRMGMEGMEEHMRHHRWHEREERMRTFALLPRVDDLKLTPPDVQRIAEGFLLWRGNHTWRVINVAADGDAIGFDLATPDGTVIARFTMDPHSGRVRRRG